MYAIFIAEFGNARSKKYLSTKRPKRRKIPKGVKGTKLFKYLRGHVQNAVSDTGSLISRVARQFMGPLPWDTKSIQKLFDDDRAEEAIELMEKDFEHYKRNLTVRKFFG